MKTLAAERRNGEYNKDELVKRIDQLLEEKNLSMRNAALRSGLDHQAIRRIKAGQKCPDMTYCILLADFFDINPNELLKLAGWPALKVFDIRNVSAASLPPEAVSVALDIARIENPGDRKEMANAIRALLKLKRK
jgi:transcriptional regulator with XRE-family HTH domain